ncbi:MAG: sirohydrochlorin cobaltochelatase [Lachnospiraceae bacterium]|nr:sirohydrochlorin cobaltochelatase [Lachnospiraceae bacterium]
MTKKAILAVSFGTTYNETRKLTIEALERDLAAAFPDAQLYRAWTSGFVIRKLEKRDGVRINNVPEALEQMLKDGITDVLVQPTHVINGIENDKMLAQIRSYTDRFASMKVGTPLLTTVEDARACAEALHEDFSFVNPDEAVLFMGHGSEHYSNFVYPALNYLFRDLGYTNFFLGTVEGYPELDSVLKDLKILKPSKIHISPFMIVAGDHANNDLAGEDEDSWKSILEAEGFAVEAHLIGLGQRERIRQLYVDHAKDAKELVE